MEVTDQVHLPDALLPGNELPVPWVSSRAYLDSLEKSKIFWTCRVSTVQSVA